MAARARLPARIAELQERMEACRLREHTCGRGRGRGRGKPEEEKWTPCTKLGRLVQQVRCTGAERSEVLR